MARLVALRLDNERDAQIVKALLDNERDARGVPTLLDDIERLGRLGIELIFICIDWVTGERATGSGRSAHTPPRG